MQEGVSELSNQPVHPEAKTPQDKLVITEEREQIQLEPLAHSLKETTLLYAKEHDAKPWLIHSLQDERYLDGIISSMRHVEEGQIFALQELMKIAPNLEWYRGGTLTTWEEAVWSHNAKFFTQEQLKTHVIDGGANGVLGRPGLAKGFLEVTPRKNPVVYRLSLEALLGGIRNEAVNLVSEHNYDLCVFSGENRAGYLTLCKKDLQIQDAKTFIQNTSIK